MEEVAVQGQALGRAFFRMKLRGKDVIAGHGRCKAATVIGLRGGMLGVGDFRIKAVHKIVPKRLLH